MITVSPIKEEEFTNESIWSKLREGIISPEEAYMKAIHKIRFRRILPTHLDDASGESPLEH